jgi:hypothetical protein
MGANPKRIATVRADTTKLKRKPWVDSARISAVPQTPPEPPNDDEPGRQWPRGTGPRRFERHGVHLAYAAKTKAKA